MTMNGTNVLGPVLAGVLVAVANPGVALAVDAGTFAVSAVVPAAAAPAAVERTEERQSFVHELAGGWGEFRSRTWLWAIVLGASILLFGVVAPFQVLGPVRLEGRLRRRRRVGADPGRIRRSAQVAGGGVALRWRPTRPLLVCACSNIVLAPPLVLLAVTAPAAAVAAGALVAGVAIGIFGTLWETTMQTQIPPDRLSRVSSYDWMGSVVFLPAGFALVGPVSDGDRHLDDALVQRRVVVLTTAMMLARARRPRAAREAVRPGRPRRRSPRDRASRTSTRPREAIGGRLHRTPTFTSATLERLTGGRVHLKAELFQRTGSFKPRGVLTKLASLAPAEKERGVIGISAGNHAPGARLRRGARGDRLRSSSCGRARASTKIAAARGYGAAVDLEATGPGEAFDRLAELLIETGRTLVHPFDDPCTIAGQGTVGLELLEDVPDANVVVVPVGGGGLISGDRDRGEGAEPERARDRRRAGGRGRAARRALAAGRAGAGRAALDRRRPRRAVRRRAAARDLPRAASTA